VVDVEHLADREPGQAEVGDVHEGVDARARLGGDEAPERRDVVGAGVAAETAVVVQV
jgi:hypothetical protein